MCMCVYLFVYVCTLSVGAIGSQKRELGSPGARVAGSCELPYVAVVKLVRVLSKSSMHS